MRHLIALAAPIHSNRFGRCPPQRRVVHDVRTHGTRNARNPSHDADPRARNVNAVAGVEDLVVDQLDREFRHAASFPVPAGASK